MMHHNFITRTDRKYLHHQIIGLVKNAERFAEEELQRHRKKLKELLEYENKIYEEEFANQVKSRIDESIKDRKDVLTKLKEANQLNKVAFLEKKRIQQHMEGCYEIRVAMRKKNLREVKECNVEQMLDKERKIRKERDLESFWLLANQAKAEQDDAQQRKEDCIKQQLKQQTKQILDIQVEECEQRRNEERKIKAEEVVQIAKLCEELRLEEFDYQRNKGKTPQKLEYRNELLNTVLKQKCAKLEEREAEINEHRAKMAELQRIDEEETAANHARRRALHDATLDYLTYVRDMRELEKNQRKMRSERIDDLARVDICTKNNIQEAIKRKAEYAAKCHAELKRQICDTMVQRLREEEERRDCRIIENRFAKPNKTREEILTQRQKNRIDLDNQIAELNRLRALEEAQYDKELLRASNDYEFCSKLAEQYMRERIDYLQPHVTWQVLACPKKEYVPKATAPYPTISSCTTCIIPCGCKTRPNIHGERNCTRK